MLVWQELLPEPIFLSFSEGSAQVLTQQTHCQLGSPQLLGAFVVLCLF